MNTAEIIKAARERSGMTQEELAEKVSVSRQAVSKWEMGLIPWKPLEGLLTGTGHFVYPTGGCPSDGASTAYRAPAAGSHHHRHLLF